MSITSSVETKMQEKVSKLESIPGLPEIQMESKPKLSNVKQLIRWISKQNITNEVEGYDRVEDVNAHLNNLYAQGYKLFATHYIGQVPEAFGVLYILTLS